MTTIVADSELITWKESALRNPPVPPPPDALLDIVSVLFTESTAIVMLSPDIISIFPPLLESPFILLIIVGIIFSAVIDLSFIC